MNSSQTYLILHNIRSAHNIGSIFRTADAANITKIFLTGYSPTPTDRFGKARSDIKKVSLGAENSVMWEYEKTPTKVINRLQKEGFKIIAIEQNKNSVDYKKVKIKGDKVFILGNEVRGLSKNILKKSDIIAEIPMQGQKESLNVSVSAGIVLFRVLGL